jgi:hypothetical protein
MMKTHVPDVTGTTTLEKRMQTHVPDVNGTTLEKRMKIKKTHALGATVLDIMRKKPRGTNATSATKQKMMRDIIHIQVRRF